MTISEAAAAAADDKGRRQPFDFDGTHHINHPGCARGQCLCAVFQRARDPASLASVQAAHYRYSEARAADERWAAANGIPLVCPHEATGERCSCFDRFRIDGSFAAASGPSTGARTPPPIARETTGPEADPMGRHNARAEAALNLLGAQPLPPEATAVEFPKLRNSADLLLALYLLEHPAARASVVTALDLIQWAAVKR